MFEKITIPLIHRLDPETAHHLAIAAFKSKVIPGRVFSDPILKTECAGLHFTNPTGLAAGFDKNAEAAEGLLKAGFGFVEVGTVTPKPQSGNQKPRLFRLPEENAVINRMGFNNVGSKIFARNLTAFRQRLPKNEKRALIGVNIGINKENADPLSDYPALARQFASLADYLVINVSSPNTKGLRDLQAPEKIGTILQKIRETEEILPPVFVKIAPDLSYEALAGIIETALAQKVTGLIISNTTISRPAGLKGRFVTETGGLSGAPLFKKSTAMLAQAYKLAQNRLVLIGVGGIQTGDEAFEKIMAGASLIQIYTTLIYKGTGIIGEINRHLALRLRREGFKSLQDAVGVRADFWAGEKF